MVENHGQFRLSTTSHTLRNQRTVHYAWQSWPKSDRTLAEEAMLVPSNNRLGTGTASIAARAFFVPCAKKAFGVAKSEGHV